ncbi:MAG TPA: hypothetical protein VN436_11265, partial [Holophaga sp.]|nr:hypothetical protein [Holophaga sp.]
MNRSKPLTIILVFLVGATRLAAQPIPESAVPSMKGRSIVYIRHKRTDFPAYTRTKAAVTGAICGLPGIGILAAGLIGGVSGGTAVASGNKLVDENGIQDPALAVSERLIENFRTAHGMTSLPPPPAPVDVRGVKPLLEQCPGADYILDVQTAGWGL